MAIKKTLLLPVQDITSFNYKPIDNTLATFNKDFFYLNKLANQKNNIYIQTLK